MSAVSLTREEPQGPSRIIVTVQFSDRSTTVSMGFSLMRPDELGAEVANKAMEAAAEAAAEYLRKNAP